MDCKCKEVLDGVKKILHEKKGELEFMIKYDKNLASEKRGQIVEEIIKHLSSNFAQKHKGEVSCSRLSEVDHVCSRYIGGIRDREGEEELIRIIKNSSYLFIEKVANGMPLQEVSNELENNIRDIIYNPKKDITN